MSSVINLIRISKTEVEGTGVGYVRFRVLTAASVKITALHPRRLSSSGVGYFHIWQHLQNDVAQNGFHNAYSKLIVPNLIIITR
jgi:hypothetical protein